VGYDSIPGKVRDESVELGNGMEVLGTGHHALGHFLYTFGSLLQHLAIMMISCCAVI